MKKYLYFQTAAAIAGDDATEEAIMVPADSLAAIEPKDASTARMVFSGKGIGNEDGATNLITVELDVASTAFKEFCRQIAKFINADVLNRDNSAYSKDGMLVVASEESGNNKFFHSSVTGCDTIQIITAAA